MRQQNGARPADRWKNLGGKRSKVVMRIPGEPSLAIIRRKGKILREGLQTLRYDQFCLGRTSEEGLVEELGADVLYHVGSALDDPPVAQKTQAFTHCEHTPQSQSQLVSQGCL